MAKDELVGNIPTEKIIPLFNSHINIDNKELNDAIFIADSIFS